MRIIRIIQPLTGMRPPRMLMRRPLRVSPAQFEARFNKLVIETSVLAILEPVGEFRKMVMRELLNDPP